MKCPTCKKELDSVVVVSECWQLATLDGNKIVDYGSVEEIGPLIKIECQECGKDLTKVVEE